MNIAVLRGTLSSAPRLHTLPSGDRLLACELTIRRPDHPTDTVPVAWPDPPRSAEALDAGDEVIVLGRVRRRFFRAGGSTASRTEVVADRVLPARQRQRVRGALARVAASLSE